MGVKKNLERRTAHYIAAAEKGHAKAMHNLAVLYAEGVDGKPDYKAAAQWFRKAADYGVTDSQYNLGDPLCPRHRRRAESAGILQLVRARRACRATSEAAKKRDDVGARSTPTAGARPSRGAELYGRSRSPTRRSR